MINAILQNRQKTQTRRIIRACPSYNPTERWSYIACSTDPNAVGKFSCSVLDDAGRNYTERGVEREMRFKPPYGLSGDRLWVKETYCQTDDGIVYRADVKPNDDEDTARIMRDYGYVWKSGRFMPRSASRILLEITSVRAERLQDITPQDVYREGLEPELTYGVDVDINGELWLSGIRKVKAAFRPLWDSINGEKPGCSWEENPAVWVYGFKRIDTGKTTPKE